MRPILRESTSITPSKHIKLNPDYGGAWTISADINNDGALELISARHDDQAVTCFGVYSIEGEFLWSFGQAGSGISLITHDLPCQAFDLYDKGYSDIFIADTNHFIQIDGKSGNLEHRYDLPRQGVSIDSICFANLQGKDHPLSILIKTRYDQIWAYSADWNLLWTWKPPMGEYTCHYPFLIDIDGDGFDEVLAGRFMLDHDGKPLWAIQDTAIQKKGHLDSVKLLSKGSCAKHTKIVFTYCSARYLALMDGTGHIVWKKRNKHFESLDLGFFSVESIKTGIPDLYVDVDHLPLQKGKNYAINSKGKLLFRHSVDYGRSHRSVDWNGDGFDEIIVANTLTLYNHKGNAIGKFDFPDSSGTIQAKQINTINDINVSIIDFSKRKTGDIMLFSQTDVAIYENPNSEALPRTFLEGKNYSLY